jgi:methionine synthase II (cobalamin-independent)
MVMLSLLKQIVSEDVDVKQKLISKVQTIINDSLDEIRAESEDWGLGEMDELEEINAIDSIVVKDVFKQNNKFRIPVTLHRNSQRYDFDNVLGVINHNVKKILGKSWVVIDDVVDDRTFGPGIDW